MDVPDGERNGYMWPIKLLLRATEEETTGRGGVNKQMRWY